MISMQIEESAKIKVEIITPVENPLIHSKLILDILQDALNKNGINFQVQIFENSSILAFDNYAAFAKFHGNLLPHFPFEENNISDDPFIVKVRYINTPKNLSIDELIKISYQPYQDMKIPVRKMPDSDIYEIAFPNYNAYFATFLKVFGELEHTSPLKAI